ncbi:rasGEF domain-containing protein [Ditylenchus destructor]|uniref:RasGEF domain-containing protein n=1 Tax=Ditylenchus destructor TaxID=166010 RepID=A0AAD4R3Z6_9BILA|nr:rasGEF domain-containing protein [Ditylenchus destructor]
MPPVSKYWGDERLTDATYAVYLKKVRYVPPAEYEGLPHYRPIDPDSHHLGEDLGGSDHLQWETIRERVIKAGTLDKLVESLVGSDERMDSRQFNVFFATYRAFAETGTVLDKFFAWFKRSTPSSSASDPSAQKHSTLQTTIRSILICWLDMYPEDFYDAETHFSDLNKLLEFARSCNLYDLKYKAGNVKKRFKRIADDGGLAAQIPTIRRYSYAAPGYDPNNYALTQHRAQMFHVGKENVVQIAEQLTFWDAVLFRELRPYQCLGAIWGRRNKNPDAVYSVRATIDQFNAVSQRVMTSIVLPDCNPEFRAKIVEKWIDIARELRALKNFSSLKAVLGSLQSEPVHRLKSTWSLISKVSMAQFKDLSAIFETDENGEEQNARTILDAEGTAKSSPLKRPQLIQNCRRTKSDVNLAESQGTVPFLGTFLTDLTMLDQAHFDTTEELINFEKRRKEFEVLAKIRLFQSAARAYTIPMDQAFCVWFFYLPALSEKEWSLEIEPASISTPDTRRRPAKSTNGFYSTPSMPITKIQSLTKMFTSFGANDEVPPPVTGETEHNDSGIHTEESWTTNSSSAGGTPNTEPAAVAMALLSRSKGMINGKDKSSTAPSTPAGTLTLRGVSNYSGSEFNPHLHFSPSSRTISRDNSPCIGNHGRASCSSTNADLPPDGSSVYRGVAGEHTLPHNRKQYGGSRGSSSRSATPSNSNMSADVIQQPRPASRFLTSNGRNGHQASQKSNSSSSSRSSYNGSMGTPQTGNSPMAMPSSDELNFHLARVGLDDSVEEGTDYTCINYKCIKVMNGDRMPTLIERALDKHLIDASQIPNYCLVQLLPDGSELKLPDHCNPFYAVAPDPTSPMLNFILKKRSSASDPNATKNRNRQKRSNLLRWSSGYL